MEMENSQIDINPKDVETIHVTEEAFDIIESVAPLIASESKENSKILNSNDALTVPYILNGELYQILSRNGENVTVKCCSCPSGRFYRGSVRSTGNFHMHIKRRHPYLLGKLHAMKVHSLLERRDRLMKNRKAKLRRILVNNKGARGEHEQHKLKIKRAFQRHQAEAKGNENGSVHELISTELLTEAVQCPETTTDVYDTDCSENKILPDKANESLTSKESIPTSSLVDASHEKEFRTLNVIQLTPPRNTISFQESAPVVTPYPSTLSCQSNTFGEYNSRTYSNLKGANYFIESPLDLSQGNRSRSPSANNSCGSSGIGLEPMWSKTTVENTISTAISINDHGSQNSSQSECGDVAWWQQHLSFILRDIHNDIRARNRIEQNRLLLEVAKLKFLHPGFCFNLQE